MSEPAQKCNYIDIFKQNYVLKLFIALKWPFFKKRPTPFSFLFILVF